MTKPPTTISTSSLNSTIISIDVSSTSSIVGSKQSNSSTENNNNKTSPMIVEKIDLEKGDSDLSAEMINEERELGVKMEEDVMIIDWKGELDPLNPKNWSNRRRMGATLIVAAFTFLSPASSTMIAPAASQVAHQFSITNSVEISMITSIFVLAYAVGPIILSPLSELYGRTIVLQLANMVYLIFNLACAFATSKDQFLAFRFLSGLGGSVPLGVGAGVLADLWRNEERGKAAALYSLGPLLGPAIGPIAGGWLAQKLPVNGYRWIFYSSTIFCAFVQIAGLLFLKETYAPVLLHRQALVLKKQMGLDSKSTKIITVFDKKNGNKSRGKIFSDGMLRPFSMIRQESIIQIFAAYMALAYGIIYIAIVSTTEVFTGPGYNQSVGVASLNFIAMGLGFFVWSQTQARLLDVVYRKLKERNGGVGVPEYRLPLIYIASGFLPFGLLLYGWAAEKQVHWIVVDFGLFFIAAAMIGIFQCTTTYLIDAYGMYAASALAAASSIRSVCGFAFPLFSPALFEKVGYGGGCSILAGVAMLMIPAAPLLYRFGARVRSDSKYAA